LLSLAAFCDVPDEQFTTAKALQDRARPEIAHEWERWNATVPPEAAWVKSPDVV
jgi:hypothetical protein